MKVRPNDPLKAASRRTGAQRRVGVGARCACGESRPEALVTTARPIRCAACDREARGKSPIDQHHPGGRANSDITIEVPVNDHRAELNAAQMDWSRTMRENPTGSPVIAAAACVRGFMDTLINLIRRLLGWIPEMLESLDAWLSSQYGSDWFRNSPIAQFARKR